MEMSTLPPIEADGQCVDMCNYGRPYWRISPCKSSAGKFYDVRKLYNVNARRIGAPERLEPTTNGMFVSVKQIEGIVEILTKMIKTRNIEDDDDSNAEEVKPPVTQSKNITKKHKINKNSEEPNNKKTKSANGKKKPSPTSDETDESEDISSGGEVSDTDGKKETNKKKPRSNKVIKKKSTK